MSTQAAHAEALAWVRERLETLRTIGATLSGYFLALTFAEAVLTRHAPNRIQCAAGLTYCKECGLVRCPDATDALAFVKAVRGMSANVLTEAADLMERDGTFDGEDPFLLAVSAWLRDVATGWPWESGEQQYDYDDNPIELSGAMDLHALKVALAYLGRDA